MGNRVTQIRLKIVPSGTEVQGIARSDRGTKYIAGSIVVIHRPGERHEVNKEVSSAIEMLLKGGN